MPTTGYYGPSYQDYISAWDQNIAPDDSGYRPAPLTEEQWNLLSPYERHQAAVGGAMQTSGYTVGQDDPLYQQFYQQFGQNNAIANSGFELGNQLQTGLALGYDSGSNGVAGPSYGRLDWNQLAIDPSRILWLDPPGTPGRRYLYERSNARGSAVVGEQARDSNSGLGDNAGLIMAALVLGGGLGANSGLLDFLPGMEGAGSGLDLGITGGLSPEEAAMGGHFTPGPGYMGDPYSLDPGFFDAGGNAIGGEGLGIGGGLDPETIALNTPGSGPPPGYMGDPYSLDPGFFDANGVATGLPGGTSLLDRLISAGPQLLQALPGITQALGGGQQGGGGARGAGLGGMASALPGGKMAGPVEVARNPYAKAPGAPNVLDLLSYVRGAR